MSEVSTHPVQVNRHHAKTGQCPTTVTLAAYEVYSHVYRPQEALITGNCRGGFGTGELIAYLYARAFPKSEWKQRVEEAFTGMKDI